jgi:plastocyanin
VKVKSNTSVSIFASSRHPLQAAEDFNGVLNPFRASDEHVQTQTHTLSEAGFYGYYCTNHGNAADGSGMGGMIWVVAE